MMTFNGKSCAINNVGNVYYYYYYLVLINSLQHFTYFLLVLRVCRGHFQQSFGSHFTTTVVFIPFGDMKSKFLGIFAFGSD